MSESPRPSKVPRRGHVTLTERSLINYVSEGCVLVGHPLRGDAAGASGLLSGLSATEGLASLPHDLSSDDVQLWQAARLLGIQPSTDELVTILKVADVLGETDQAAWVEKLAERVIGNNWTCSDRADSMLCSLLALPPHLLHCCLLNCAPLWQTPLPQLIATLPTPLQQPVIAAVVASVDGKLEIDLPDGLTLLPLLSGTVVPEPGMRELWLRDDSAAAISSVQAAVLARALCAHPTLTNVHLYVCLPPPALKRFTLCLERGALPKLVSLHLSTHDLSGGCAALIDCLKRLPSLTTLGFSIMRDQRLGIDDCALDPLVRSAAVPALLPNLRYLSMLEEVSTRGQDADDGSVDPLTCPSILPTFFSLMSMTALTDLCFETKLDSISFRALWAAIHRLPALRSVLVITEARDDPPRHPLCTDTGDVSSTICDATVLSRCPVSPLLLTAAAGQALLGVTSLTLAHEEPDHKDTARRCNRREVRHAWAALLSALRQCMRLQRLHLATLSGVHRNVREGVRAYSSNLACTLSRLSALTHLTLRAANEMPVRLAVSHCQLHGQALGGAVAALTALQTLCICNGRGTLEVLEPQSLLDACTALSRLSRLGLCMCAPQEVPLRVALPKLRALRTLQLGGDVLSQVGGSTDSLSAQFPGISFDECNCWLAE